MNSDKETDREQALDLTNGAKPFKYVKPACKSGGDPPPSFINDLLAASDRSEIAIVIQKEHTIEPHLDEITLALVRL